MEIRSSCSSSYSSDLSSKEWNKTVSFADEVQVKILEGPYYSCRAVNDWDHYRIPILVKPLSKRQWSKHEKYIKRMRSRNMKQRVHGESSSKQNSIEMLHFKLKSLSIKARRNTRDK